MAALEQLLRVLLVLLQVENIETSHMYTFNQLDPSIVSPTLRGLIELFGQPTTQQQPRRDEATIEFTNTTEINQ